MTMPSIYTLTAQALPCMAIIRNQGNLGPNVGSILAAEIVYIAIVPFAVVEGAIAMTALLFAWLLCPFTIIFPGGFAENRFAMTIELAEISAGFMADFGISLLWALATAVMNLLPVRLLETQEQALLFFRCQDPHPLEAALVAQAPAIEVVELDQEELIPQRPVRSNAMSGFLRVGYDPRNGY